MPRRTKARAKKPAKSKASASPEMAVDPTEPMDVQKTSNEEAVAAANANAPANAPVAAAGVSIGASGYYYVDPQSQYETLQPSLRADVIRLYGLLDLTDSLSRTNPDGSKGVKLRKSYKNHIADLPGKYTIPTERTLSPVVCAPDNPDMPDQEITPFDVNYLEGLFNFEKSSINGVPGFDASQLALDTVDSPVSRGSGSPAPPSAAEKKRRRGTSPEKKDSKRRHIQVRFR